MFFDLIFFICSIVFAIIGIKYKYKLLLIFSITDMLLSLVSLIIRIIFGLQFIPHIKLAVYLIFLVLTIGSFSLYISKNFGVILTITLIVSSLVFFVYGSFVGVVVKNFDGKNYVGIYENITGLGETVVTYYDVKLSILMSTEYSFSENYGILLCGSDEIFDNQPYKIEYNPNLKDK